MKREVVLEIICCLFVLLFLYTGIMKVLEHDVFFNALLKSPLLKPFAFILAILIPLAELVIAISILIPKTRRAGLYGFLLMMSIFTVYIGFMLYFRSDRPCTCGGIIKYMNWHQHFYFNSGFTLLTVLAIWIDKRSQQQSYQKKDHLSYIS